MAKSSGAFAMGRPILAAEARRVDGQKEFAAARGAAVRLSWAAASAETLPDQAGGQQLDHHGDAGTL